MGLYVIMPYSFHTTLGIIYYKFQGAFLEIEPFPKGSITFDPLVRLLILTIIQINIIPLLIACNHSFY